MTNPTDSEALVAVEQIDREAARLLRNEIERQIGKRPCLAVVEDADFDVQLIAKARIAEREACAKVAEAGWSPAYVTGGFTDPDKWEPGSPWDRGAVDACKRVAEAIRSRSLAQPTGQE